MPYGIDIASDQVSLRGVACTVLNLKTGKLFSLDCLMTIKPELPRREVNVLQLMKQGLLSKEIANELGISIHTVNIHRQHLLRKLGVQNAMEAVNRGYKMGLIV